MITGSGLIEAIRRAWSPIPAPPVEDLRHLAKSAHDTLAGVAPMEVDIESPGFQAATPLLELPPRAAAAYLGPYLLNLVREIEEQRATGFSLDVLARADTVAALLQPFFWERVVRTHLPVGSQEVLGEVVAYLTAEPQLVPLTDEEVQMLRSLASDDSSSLHK